MMMIVIYNRNELNIYAGPYGSEYFQWIAAENAILNILSITIVIKPYLRSFRLIFNNFFEPITFDITYKINEMNN